VSHQGKRGRRQDRRFQVNPCKCSRHGGRPRLRSLRPPAADGALHHPEPAYNLPPDALENELDPCAPMDIPVKVIRPLPSSP